MTTSWQKYRQRAEVELAMTPMIDVVFLLLVFFLATASFEKVEKSMPTGVAELPAASSNANGSIDDWVKEVADTKQDVIIKIIQADPQSAPSYLVNDQPLDRIEAVELRIAALVKNRTEQPIIVEPNDNVPMKYAMQVYDLAKGVGAIEVFFAAKP